MPFGKGRVSGQGSGQGTGRCKGRGGGRGRSGGNRPSSGIGGNCVCPSCGEKIGHQAGMPCYSVSCPKCGANMVRE